MRIFITGSNGQLAKAISPLFTSDEVMRASKSQLDITDKTQVLKEISQFKPDIVFHFASMTRGDECAKNPDLAYRINVEGTKNVVHVCKKINAAVLFVSTNEVFDGKKRSPYHETDTPNPLTVVGKTKWDAENYIKNNLKKYYIIRTSWLYSKWSANFLHAVLKKAVKDQKIELVMDEVSSPTYSSDLSDGIFRLLQTKNYGTYHLSNTGAASRLEFAKKAFEVYGVNNVLITPIPLEKYKRISKPPLYTPLENIRAKKLGIHLPDWDDALVRFLSENEILNPEI